MKKLLLSLLLALPVVAEAQSYPHKPIRWVVPYTDGGITDFMAPAGAPEHFGGFLRSEVERWAKVVRDAGIKAD